jgi:membrane protein DedA with SNARE-associated domain
MEELIANNVPLYGPFAVLLLLLLSGVGIPVGEDVVVIPAGVLVSHGHLSFWPTALCAYAGVVAADCMWFGICYRYGTRLLHKRWFKRLLHPRRLLQAKHQFERRGTWVIVMARFIPTSRTTAVTAAGMLHMPFWKFALATGTCVVATVPIQLGIGLLIARGFGSVGLIELLLRMAGLVMVILAVMLGIAWVQRQRGQEHRLPRAKASWLRRFRRRRAQEGNRTGGPKSGQPVGDRPTS